MTRTSRETWLDDGLALLQQSGKDQVRIDTLCERLNMTKGSFYHHFQNHQAYLEALLEHWEDKYTSKFIDHAEKGDTPAGKLERLSRLTLSASDDPEIHIRAWALTDKLAQQTVARVDQRRIDYLIQLYSELGMNPSQALIISRVIYATLIGSQYLLPQLTKSDLEAMFNFIAEQNSNYQTGE